MVSNSVLLNVNEEINKHYRSSYSGASEGKTALASDIINLCNKYPKLSEEVNLYPLNDVFGIEIASAISKNINIQEVPENSIQMNR